MNHSFRYLKNNFYPYCLNEFLYSIIIHLKLDNYLLTLSQRTYGYMGNTTLGLSAGNVLFIYVQRKVEILPRYYMNIHPSYKQLFFCVHIGMYAVAYHTFPCVYIHGRLYEFLTNKNTKNFTPLFWSTFFFFISICKKLTECRYHVKFNRKYTNRCVQKTLNVCLLNFLLRV